MERQPSYAPESSEKQSKTQPYANVQDFSEATKQPINAKKDRSTAAGIRANQFDVTIKQLAPAVQYLLREREAAHQQELEKMKQLYMVSGLCT